MKLEAERARALTDAKCSRVPGFKEAKPKDKKNAETLNNIKNAINVIRMMIAQRKRVPFEAAASDLLGALTWAATVIPEYGSAN